MARVTNFFLAGLAAPPILSFPKASFILSPLPYPISFPGVCSAFCQHVLDGLQYSSARMLWRVKAWHFSCAEKVLEPDFSRSHLY